MKRSWPLAIRGKIIGVPGQGTHSYTAPPNNWQSDRAYDIACPSGTPVLAIIDGKIGSRIGPLPGGGSGRFAGIRMYVEHANGNEYYFAHLSKIEKGIKAGSRVSAGTIIGYSGVANGVPHLHVAVKLGSPALKILGGVTGLARHWWAKVKGVTSVPHPKLAA